MNSIVSVKAFILIHLASHTKAQTGAQIQEEWDRTFEDSLYSSRFYLAERDLIKSKSISKTRGFEEGVVRMGTSRNFYSLTLKGRAEAKRALNCLRALAVGD